MVNTGIVMPIRRTLKNVVKNYSDAQIKVREATSNDAWGPSTTLMSEIADLTYNVVAYAEIMPILWHRLEDTGRNWRHVYKSLVLLDYLVRTGSERIARECRERAWAIQAIADSFEFAESADGQDRGAGVRERARALTALLRDDDRLRNERAKALKARERFAQNTAAVSASTLGASAPKYSGRSISPLHSIAAFTDSSGGGAGGYTEFGSPSLSSLDASQFGLEGGSNMESELESIRPTSAGEEELQLQLALAMSKEEHDEEVRRLKGDEAKLQMALDESRRQAAQPSSSPVQFAVDDLFDSEDAATGVSGPWHRTSNAFTCEPQIAAKTCFDPWMSSPPLLPPPPSESTTVKQLSSSNTAASDAWLCAPTSTAVTGSGNKSARSSPWQSPAHQLFDISGSVTVDTEFDILGARSNSPHVSVIMPPAVPPRRLPAGSDAVRLSDPWDMSDVERTVHQDADELYGLPLSKTANMSPVIHSTHCNKKSARDFLGDNANLVNLDNLITLPGTNSVSANPFASSSRASSPAVMTTNPFGQPLMPGRLTPLNQLNTSSVFTAGDTSQTYCQEQPSYPPAFNPFL